MDIDELFRLAEEAEEVLEQTLTADDQEELQGIYKRVSKQISWDRVLDNAFPLLLELAEELVETETMCKNASPWDDTLESEQILFDNGDDKVMARRHSLLLMLAKKLLGGLKTRVNQSMGDIRILSQDEETELVAVIDEAEELEREIRLDEDDEEVLDEEENEVARTEVVAQVDIAPEGDCRQSGRHVRTTVRWKRKNDDMIRETYCKDCRQIVESIAAQKTKLEPKQCRHPGAEWVDGKEGEEARCTECQEPIPNPETYHWVDAGLEPYGDDPSQDEAITLCSDY